MKIIVTLAIYQNYIVFKQKSKVLGHHINLPALNHMTLPFNYISFVLKLAAAGSHLSIVRVAIYVVYLIPNVFCNAT